MRQTAKRTRRLLLLSYLWRGELAWLQLQERDGRWLKRSKWSWASRGKPSEMAVVMACWCAFERGNRRKICLHRTLLEGPSLPSSSWRALLALRGRGRVGRP